MSLKQTLLRRASLADASALTRIYNEYTQDSNNYTWTERSTEQTSYWLMDIMQQGFPVYVAVVDGEIAGYGALTPFHVLEGYSKSASGVLYVSKLFQRSGCGRLLGQKLIDEGRAMQLKTILAGMNSLNKASIGFHKQMGFTEAGVFKSIGHCNGVFYDDICMQFIY